MAKLSIPEDWRAVEQPELRQQIDQARPLKVESLGTAVYGVDDPANAGACLVPHADGKAWDALLWYRKAYRQETRVYVVDLGTGQVMKQAFAAEQGKIRMELGFSWWGVFADDGKLYGANPDWTKWDTGGAMNIYRYDPADKKVALFKVIPGHGGERNPLALSPNGWVYGAGTWCAAGPDRYHKASAYGFNPQTGEVRDFGAIGPQIKMTGYGYTMGACDTHIYVACGQTPWYLVAVDVKTGEQKVLLTAPEGGFTFRMLVSDRYYGGAACYTQQSDDAPREYYWLYHGQAIPKRAANLELDDSCPWKPMPFPLDKAGTKPELSLAQTYPDDNNRATLWWRPKAGEGAWQAVRIEGVEKHPLEIHRMVALPDGRLFGMAHSSKGRFLFDPATDKVTVLGDGAISAYPMIIHEGKVYWSGYPSAPIFAFDPGRPWTLQQPLPPGAKPVPETSAESNPRRVHEDYFAPYKKTRVKRMLGATVAADGCIYFGGKGERDYDGGGLSWYDPKTGQVDGLWEPFAGRGLAWVTTAVNGRYVVIGTRSSKTCLFDTQTHKLIGDFEAVPGATRSGPILEVAPGRMLGVTHDPEVQGGAVLYGIEVPSSKIVFRKKLPDAVPFDWIWGTDKWDYQLGPDGFIWTTLGRTIVRIDPRDARVHVLGKLDTLGKMAFVGRDLYLTGAEPMRRIRDIAPTP